MDKVAREDICENWESFKFNFKAVCPEADSQQASAFTSLPGSRV